MMWSRHIIYLTNIRDRYQVQLIHQKMEFHFIRIAQRDIIKIAIMTTGIIMKPVNNVTRMDISNSTTEI